jgi:hypothetical protein
MASSEPRISATTAAKLAAEFRASEAARLYRRKQPTTKSDDFYGGEVIRGYRMD